MAVSFLSFGAWARFGGGECGKAAGVHLSNDSVRASDASSYGLHPFQEFQEVGKHCGLCLSCFGVEWELTRLSCLRLLWWMDRLIGRIDSWVLVIWYSMIASVGKAPLGALHCQNLLRALRVAEWWMHWIHRNGVS